MSKQTYTHLTQEERWQIKALRESGNGVRSIARQLERSASTISSEIKLGALPSGGYSPKRAQRLYLRSKKTSGIKRRKLTGNLWRGVRNALLNYWSPEQIAGWLDSKGLAK